MRAVCSALGDDVNVLLEVRLAEDHGLVFDMQEAFDSILHLHDLHRIF